MDELQDMLKKLGKLNQDIDTLVSAGEKLGETLMEVVNEIEKLVTTKAEVNTITIREED
jgi:DNA anti-recombination protein RmuC|tara:strand:- start:870 stop:1046 length:177 start_codon:yes stop_codon:yes gene_type:complete